MNTGDNAHDFTLRNGAKRLTANTDWLLILSFVLIISACSQAPIESVDTPPTVTEPPETHKVFEFDLVQRADELCKVENDCRQALGLYSQALDEDRDLSEVYGKRAMAYYALKSFEPAVADFTEAINRKPNNAADLYFMRGLAKSMLLKEDQPGACQDFASAKKSGYKPTSTNPSGEWDLNEWLKEYCPSQNLRF